MPDSEIAKLDETGEAISDLTFYSPASGYVTERNALPNMYVQPDTKLYAIAVCLGIPQQGATVDTRASSITRRDAKGMQTPERTPAAILHS